MMTPEDAAIKTAEDIEDFTTWLKTVPDDARPDVARLFAKAVQVIKSAYENRDATVDPDYWMDYWGV